MEGNRSTAETAAPAKGELHLHPAWLEFIRYCQQMRHGEVERLSIQDGLPVLAERVKTKVRFTR